MMAHELPSLDYSFDALEPHIDAQTMEIHHDRHHATYVAGLNAALESHSDLNGVSVEDLISDIEALPEGIRTAVRNSGGGHWNHSFFWQIMSPNDSEPGGELLDAILAGFGTLEEMKSQFAAAAAARFGSGWAWVIKNSAGHLMVTSTPNQDNPLMDGSGVPILGIDVWEHAYYLKYQNKRPDYVQAWFNTINWDAVARRFET